MLSSLRRDTALNLIGNVLPLGFAVITIPALMDQLGTDSFGVLSLVWALIGYFGVFDLGVGRALTYEVRLSVSQGKVSDLRSIIWAGLMLTILTGIVGSLIVGFLIAPFSGDWFGVTGDLQVASRFVFEITALAIVPTTITSGLRGALEGFGQFYESNIIRGLIGSLMFLAPYAAITLGSGHLEDAAYYLMYARYSVMLLAIYWLRKMIFVRAKYAISYFKRILNFGVWVTVTGIVSPLMVYGDRFFVSAAVGVERLTFYAIPQEGLQRMLIIPGALTSALMPRMVGVQLRSELLSMYKKNLFRIALIMLLVCIVAAFVAYPLLSAWLSQEFADQAILPVYVLLGGVWFNSLAQLPNTLLYSVGKPKVVALVHSSELFAYIALISFLASEYGVLGAAIAWSLRVIVDFFLLDYLAKREIAG